MFRLVTWLAFGALVVGPPGDPWTDLHASVFLRGGPDGKTYGEHELDPLLWPSSRWLMEPDRNVELLEGLGKMRREDVEKRSVRERLVMQRDLWAVHDWVVARDADSPLGPALARAMRDVSATPKELRELRTRTEGVVAFPGGLLDATGGWVRLSDKLTRPMTPAHDREFDGRSYFEVLIRLPRGKTQTVEWLEGLNAMPSLLEDNAGAKHLRSDIPQLPLGTQLALVRRALAIASDGTLMVSDLVESVQIRRILANDIPNPDEPSFRNGLQERERFALAQSVREFRLGRSGEHALQEFSDDDLDFSRLGSHGEDPFTASEQHWSAQAPGLVKCVGCHGQPGVYSVNSITRIATGPGTIFMVEAREEPTVAVPSDGATARDAALEFKRGHPSWKALEPYWSASSR